MQNSNIEKIKELGLKVKLDSNGYQPGILKNMLDTGMVGVIGHKSYAEKGADGVRKSVYLNVAFVFDPAKHEVVELKIIGTRPCYPDGPAKRPELVDCAFTSGIVMRPDGKADLYSGIGDAEEGRITIDYPFAGYGSIVSRQSLA